MATDPADQPIIRMFFALAALSGLSLAGFLVGKNIAAESASGGGVVNTTEVIPPPTVAPPTTISIVGVQIVGTAGSFSMADSVSGVNLIDIGECFNLAALASGVLAGAVEPDFAVATSVSCNEEHHYQNFWQGKLGSEVVDFAATQEAARALCNWQFAGFVGVTVDATQFDFWWSSPDETNWPTDRSVSCTLALKDESSWIGSGEGSLW